MKSKKIIALFILITVILLTIRVTALTKAQTSSACSTTGTAITEGLVSTPSLNSNFVTSSGACVVNPKAAFAPFKIPTYADLKSLYYDQSKLTQNTMTSLPNSFSADGLYQVSGDLTISSNPTGSGIQLIFIKGNLNINANYTYGSTQSGTVFVVKDNINVNPTVTRIDAVLISEGQFCSNRQAQGGCKNTPGGDQQLTINGSIISLGLPPIFARSLTDNSQPAELINHQVKYLVILRNLMSDTFQRWSEIP